VAQRVLVAHSKMSNYSEVSAGLLPAQFTSTPIWISL
jgi:hypothetical protein